MTDNCLQVFPDNFMRREVLTLVVHCTFMEDGCAWKGEVRHLEVLNCISKSNMLELRVKVIDCAGLTGVWVRKI